MKIITTQLKEYQYLKCLSESINHRERIATYFLKGKAAGWLLAKTKVKMSANAAITNAVLISEKFIRMSIVDNAKRASQCKRHVKAT